MTKPIEATPARRAKSVLRRLKRNERGTTAIEFAIVAVPFFAFIFQTIEVALVYGGTVSLEHALEKVARTIRVGNPASSSSDFRNQVCAEVVLLRDCQSKLIVDVRTLGGLGDASNTNVMNEYSTGGQLNGPGDPGNPGTYNTGAGGTVVLVNAFYKWDIVAQLPIFYNWESGNATSPLANQGDGSRVLSATVAFVNEPFPGAGG
ncbi:MAG: TadE/TadG family type IV pilus assembly protein [Hyphomicrobiaceae bacterium]